MSTPAKRVSKLAKQPTAKLEEKATPSGKKARKRAKTEATRGENNPSTEKAAISAVEVTPSKPTATLAKRVITPKKKEHEKEQMYCDSDEGESEEAAMAPDTKPVGGKSNKSRSRKSAGENVTKSKEPEVNDVESDDEGGLDTALLLSEDSAPAEIHECIGEHENEDKETQKKPVKRKKKVSKEKSTPETKRPKTEKTGIDYCLYLGNLNSAKDSEELKDDIIRFFTKNSLTVCSVRIGSSKKFGYANFFTAADLEKALEMNGGKILGMECNLKARNREGLAEMTREREARTLFAKNLPYSTTPGDLQDIFSNTVNLRMPVRKDGSARGISYIEFENEAEADKAFKEKQGANVKGRPVILDYMGDKSRKRVTDLKTLVVSNISKKATESSLKEVFQKAISIRIKQHNSAKQKGVALVEFSTEEDAKEGLKLSNKVVIEGLKVHLMLQGAQPTQTKTLFVRGLSRETTENSLKEAFDGAVGCRVATDQNTGVCKGFGFVDFSTSEDASAAKVAMEGFEIDGNMVTLEFAKAKVEGSRGFGGRSEDSKGEERGGKGHGGGGRGRGGKKVVKGGGGGRSSAEEVEGGITGKGTGGKKAERDEEKIGGRGGKLGFGNARVGMKGGVRGFGGGVGGSRGPRGGKSGFVGTDGGIKGSEQSRGGFGGRVAGTSKGRFGGKSGGGRGGLEGRGGARGGK